jgi:TIR domain
VTGADDVHPLFFLSYARTAQSDQDFELHGPDHDFVTFFNDLSKQVAGLVSRRPGADPGFMDRSISAGRQWSKELLWAIGNCEVFVALLSGPYTSSQWCGKEWGGYAQRKVIGDGRPNPRLPIIPVIWAPFPDELTPQVIRSVQRFSPGVFPDADVRAEYEQYGVSGLLWMFRTASYRSVVWRLAMEIARFHHSKHSVEPRTLSEGELYDAFQESGT